MTQWLNPDCLKTNPLEAKFCQNCGEKLVLAERYRPLKIIGQGGFGRTFQAVDEYRPSKPFCVIKQFFPQAQGTKKREKAASLFAQEAERLDTLGRHPQIPELFAYYTQDNRQYLVQEFIDGQNLKQELELSGAFNERQIWELLKSLLPVLEFIHSKQVIHRDIKPENIIRRRRDNQLLLVDFGAAKYATNTALAATGTVIGSAGYAAPEQALGKATFASDIYSLGVTSINLLTQVEPFDLFDVSEGEWVWREYLKFTVSDEVAKLLDKMIVGATKKRFQNVGEILSVVNPKYKKQINSTYKPKIFPIFTKEVAKGETFTFEVVTVNNSGKIIKRTQRNGRQKIEYLGNGIKLEMVYIPGGSFLIGSAKNEARRTDKESFQYQVTLQPFCMSKYPITQDQYLVIMGENPSYFKGGNRPVERVTWHNATEFCQRLSEKTRKIYRLPSQSQWEYACRAGTTTPFYFGETITSELANYNGNYTYGNAPQGKYREHTTDVGSFPPNAFGLYDMHGNVDEWCQDIWHNSYEGVPTDGSAWESGGNSELRVLCGGSWNDYPWWCRSADRDWDNTNICINNVGFRVICLFGL
ncbi:MAG: bifunctional serine/threonine-protein kinase/formylglycine-generating enzyme family protein [Trichodesmium sp. MO_231.B1]|nr:bifunctional serine/threonine-protein kinase/formylglycine-generating enzyme family protein [Trichodesmium sp. MO_231.B1]